MWGAVWMFMCFIVFASVGSFVLNQDDPTLTPGAGSAMIVFACLFIAGYAMTWGPVIWVSHRIQDILPKFVSLGLCWRLCHI